MNSNLKFLTKVFIVLFSFLITFNIIAQNKRSSVSTLKRDSHGRIKRSESAREKFMRQTGYTHGRPGYIIDHIIPLSEGGKDDPSNMQWQTISEAKTKDKWERGQTLHQSNKSIKTHKSSFTRQPSFRKSKSDYGKNYSKSFRIKSNKNVQVHSYVRKSGTSVKSYKRSSPGFGSHHSSYSHRRK